MKTTDLRSIPVGSTFHIPQMGVEGTVLHRGIGSVTVRYTETVTRTRNKRDKKTGQPRMVTSTRNEAVETQWSPGTEVVPGPAPADMPRRSRGGEPGMDDEGGEDEVVPARRVVARSKKAPRPEGTEAVMAKGKGATWPQTMRVPGRFMARNAPDGTPYADIVGKLKGVKKVAAGKTAGGTSVLYDVTAAGAAALLTHLIVHRKDSRRAGQKLVTELAKAGADIKLRATGNGEVFVVDGEVAP